MFRSICMITQQAVLFSELYLPYFVITKFEWSSLPALYHISPMFYAAEKCFYFKSFFRIKICSYVEHQHHEVLFFLPLQKLCYKKFQFLSQKYFFLLTVVTILGQFIWIRNRRLYCFCRHQNIKNLLLELYFVCIILI